MPERATWSVKRIVDEIRSIRASGVVPSQRYVVKHRADLYGAAQRLCGGYRRALLLAGEDPCEVAAASRREAGRRKAKWTRSTILETLASRKALAQSLSVDAMKAAGLGGMLSAARKLFGSYGAAVGAAGFDYAQVRRIAPDWSALAVGEAIAELAADGNDLNVSTAQHLNSGLVTAGIRFFGSWDGALRAAGFDPGTIRLDVNTEAGKGRVFENLCDALFAEIRPGWRLNHRHDTDDGPLLPDAYDPVTGEWIDFKLAAWGMSVASSIRKYGPHAPALRFITLTGSRAPEPGVTFQSVFDFEGGMPATATTSEIFSAMRVLRAADVPATSLEAWTRVWTKEKLVAFIQQLPEDDASARAAQAAHPREYSAVVRQFGGWYEGVAAAGLPVEEIRRRRPEYTSEDIAQFIRDRHTRGEGLSAKAVTATSSGSGLYQAATRLYGGWSNALAATGVRSDSVDEFTLSKEATRERLFDFIRTRRAAGAPLNAQHIRDEFKAMYKVAFRLAGGWRQAVEACGIEYSEVCDVAPPRRVSKDDIDRYIKARHAAGLPLNTSAVMKDNRAVHTAACRVVYGSWKQALESNGVYREKLPGRLAGRRPLRKP